MDCENCGRADKEKPSIFRGERWCSDLCRKALENKASQPTLDPDDVINPDTMLTRRAERKIAEDLNHDHYFNEECVWPCPVSAVSRPRTLPFKDSPQA